MQGFKITIFELITVSLDIGIVNVFLFIIQLHFIEYQ